MSFFFLFLFLFAISLSGEFVIMLLTMMGKLNERDIMLTATIFDKLDYNGDGENHWFAVSRNID